MRRMAIQELRLRGIRYLLLPNDDALSRDLLVYSRAWGLAPVASEGGAHLLAIQ
jgi:hypothetical protein